MSAILHSRLCRGRHTSRLISYAWRRQEPTARGMFAFRKSLWQQGAMPASRGHLRRHGVDRDQARV